MAMSLFFADGFDHYNNLALNWSSVPGGNVTIETSSGQERTGLGCCRINTGAFGPLRIHAGMDRIIVSGAVNPGNQAPGLFSNFFRFGRTNPNQFFICYNNDLSVCARYENSGTPLGGVFSAANVITLNTYNYITARILFHPVAGSVDIWVNGVLVLSVTGQTTDVSACTSTQLMVDGGFNVGYWDDFSMWTWANAGDVFPYVASVYPAMAVTDSTPLAWTPSTGTNHAALVDEIPPSLTDYVSSATVGQVDQYVHAIPANQQVPPIPAATNILGCVHALYAQVDSGASSLKSNKAGVAGSDILVLTTTPTYYRQAYTPGLAALTDLPTTPLGPEVVA